MKMTVTSVQRTFTATLKTILPYNLFLLYLYTETPSFVATSAGSFVRVVHPASYIQRVCTHV
jgi:hypothetical protein